MRLGRLACVSALVLVALPSRARADVDVDITLHDGKLFVDADDVHEETPLACAQGLAFVRRDAHVFVACGAEGLAVYTLEGSHLTLSGRVAHDASCVGVTREGRCELASSAPPVHEAQAPPPEPVEAPHDDDDDALTTARKRANAAAGATMRDVGIGLLIASVGSLAAAVTLALAGSGQRDSAPYDIPAIVLTIGALTAPLVGVPLYFFGASKVSRAYAFVTPMGGGIRITF